MDRILNFGFFLFMIGMYWIAIADSQLCDEVGYLQDKCEVCAHDKNCPRCKYTNENEECRHDNTCRCKEGYGRDFDLCVRATGIAQHGDRCDHSIYNFCNTFSDSTICHPDILRCVCFDGYDRDADIKLCVPRDGLILEVCNAPPDTCNTIDPLKCDTVTNRCHVKKGYKYNCETFGYEKGKGEYNDTCDEDSCSTAQQGCKPCNPDSYLECQNRACDCKSGYFWNPNQRKCIAGAQQPGADCGTVKHCDPNAHLECNNGFCVCIYGYVLDETTNKCVKSTGHDEECSKFMCDPNYPHMVCHPQTKKCECKEGYYYHTMLKKCVKYKEYNEICESVDCNPKSNLECKNRTFCVCKEGFKYGEGEKRCKAEGSKWWMWIIIGFVIGVLLGFAIFGSLWFFLYYRKNKKKIIKKPSVSKVKKVKKSSSEVTTRKSTSSIPGKRKSRSPSVSSRLTRSSLIPSKKLNEALKGVGAW